MAFADALAAHQAGDAATAERICRALLETEPGNARVYRLLGILLLERGEPAQARDHFQRAVAIDPRQPSYYQNLAMALGALGEDAGVLVACEQAIRLKPDYALAWFNRGEALVALSRFEEGLASHERALSLGLSDGRPLCGMGIAYYLLERFDKARACFEQARISSPNMPGLDAKILFCTMRICDWAPQSALSRAVIADVETHKAQLEPFVFISLPTTPAQQKLCAEIFASAECPPQPPMARMSRRGGRLRIAYVSKDYSNHPVTYLIAQTLEQHDRERFEIFAISYGPDRNDGGRARIGKAVDHFIDVRNLTDRQAAETMAALDIDIAVDLVGHTRDARPGILSWRPARVQVNYLGYAGTLGAPHLDYLIGDVVATPSEHAPHYSEKLVQLPVCYLPPGSRPAEREWPAITRAACGLPAEGVVFCAFNNSYKITPEMFGVWMRLLAQLPGSVLWLRDDNALAAANLRREAQMQGVDPARLVFSPFASAREHFARMALADLFLDTSPYNAHTTAADALWVGLPIVTLMGEAFAGRVAASLLTQADLADMIAPSLARYESLALRYATDRAFRNDIRARLAASRAALFDAAVFARHLESAFTAMWARHESGKPPLGFPVSAIAGA